jgi:serine/threonine protein kinase
MPGTPATHPSAEDLQSFGLGKLNDAAAEVILRHLENCPGCHKQVAALSGDSFLDKLRAARGRSSTPTPARSLSGVARSLQPTREPRNPPPTVGGLPPELANSTQYEVMRELGRGGMGVVYLAKNVLMDRMEVLKVLSKGLLDKAGAADRFLREIRSAAKLSHENVVKAYSALSLGELLVFAMEYVDGEDLSKVVKERGPLPVPHACFYAHQAAMGLQHAHEHGLIHRDIKPHNLILARLGKKHFLKILDFGLAKATREGDADTDLTGAGKMMGTPDYIAPEQTLDAANADIRADIYSLGCTLYFLLTGAPPFQGKSLYAILQAHISMEARPLDQVRPGIPAELVAVVAKMMAKEPAQRYQKPVEVAQALVPLIKAAGKAAPPETAGKSAPSKEPGPFEMMIEGSATIAGAQKRTPRAPAPKSVLGKWWPVGAGAGLAMLLLILGILWAAGLFKVKSKDGTIVLENLPDNAEVLVDGDAVKIKMGDGKLVEVGAAADKKHQLEVKLPGFKVFGKEVEIDAGGRQKIAVHLDPLKPDPPVVLVPKKDGIVVLKNLPSGAEVTVDGDPVMVKSVDEKTGEFPVVPDRLHQVKVKKKGFQDLLVEDVKLDAGGRETIIVRLEPVEPKEPKKPPEDDREERVSFFNGKNLMGWEGLNGYWRAVDDAIVGSVPPGKPAAHTFLVSKKTYRDFDLKFQVRRQDGVGNSGVQFRSAIKDRDKFTVIGPQCEIDSATFIFPPGSLVTEPTANPLAVKAPQAKVAKAYKDSDFNDFHIRCIGKHVTIKVNGVTTVDGDYDSVPDEGVIAWQLHGSMVPREVTFRKIEFTDLTDK